MKKAILVGVILYVMTVNESAVMAALLHHWDFTQYSNGTPLSSVNDIINGVNFDTGLDEQAIIQNGALDYTPMVGTYFATADVVADITSYRWTIDFESFVAVEDAIGDGRRMHFGLYSSTQDILSNVHPTSSVAQIRFISTNPPSEYLLARRFTVLGDSGDISLASTLDDFQLSFLINEDSYEVTITDDGKTRVLFAGSDTRPEDLASVRHFILSGLAFNGGNVQARIRSIQITPEPATLLLFGLGGLALRRRKS